MADRRIRNLNDLDALARDLVRLAGSMPKALTARVEALSLAEQAELALRLPPQARLELLLHAPKPMALVRSLPDGDVYLTIREVGPLDALPLLAVTSASQLVHLIDLEAWRGDRFDAERAGAWIAILAEAGEPTVRRFLRAADDAVLTLVVRDWFRVRPIEIDHEEPVHGHGLTDTGDELGFVSPDGAYRFAPTSPEHVPSVRRVADVLFHDDRERYARLLWESAYQLPSEIEEEAYRWRQSRLEEHGYPEDDEARSIYAAPEGSAERFPLSPPDRGETPTMGPRSLLAQTGPSNTLARVADRLTGAERENLLFEVASLANKVLVADGADAGDPKAHRRSLDKAASYVGIALEARGASGEEEFESILGRVPAIELFREGYSRAAALGQRARGLLTEGWMSLHPRALEILEGPIRARVRGLLLPRPRAYDPETEEEVPYREFRALAEVDEARAALDLAETAGGLLFGRLGAAPAVVERGHTMSAIFLTALARHAVRSELSAAPIPVDVAEAFVRGVGSSSEAATRALEDLLAALGDSGALDPRDLALLRVFGKASLDRLAADCGRLGPLTPPTPANLPCLVFASAEDAATPPVPPPRR